MVEKCLQKLPIGLVVFTKVNLPEQALSGVLKNVYQFCF
jgi:hypothetical protein